MTKAKVATLSDRGVVAVTGADAVKFLHGLLTNDLERLEVRDGRLPFDADAAHAALLSPQGKILFDAFCVRTPDGFVLDVARDKAAELAKRLSLYKLRAAVRIEDVSDAYVVLALWGEDACSLGPTRDTIAFRDPRHPDLGIRILAEARFATDIASATNGTKVDAQAYQAHRIGLGVPEGGKDFPFGDAFPHEALMDQLAGVSFSKGCYVGQEIVSRMQHRGTARKRIVPVVADTALPAAGSEIAVAGTAVGSLGSTAGQRGLALVRLDRVGELAPADTGLTAGGIPIRIELPPWATFGRGAPAAQT
jgi:hypothetical protein